MSNWYDTYEKNTRKAVALDLVLGGLEIAVARDLCGIKKMPMQYYMQVRGVKRPILGASQRGLGIERLRGAVNLLEHGALPEEVLFLTKVALQTLLRVDFPLPPPGRRRRGRKKKRAEENAVAASGP